MNLARAVMTGAAALLALAPAAAATSASAAPGARTGRRCGSRPTTSRSTATPRASSSATSRRRDNAQAKAVAEVIQRTDPDVILLNEFDYVEGGAAVDLFRDNYLEVGQGGASPVDYPYAYVAPVNTGVPSGFDLNNDGTVGGGDDAFGFGLFPGQYGMVVLSKYPIQTDGGPHLPALPLEGHAGQRPPDRAGTRRRSRTSSASRASRTGTCR